MRRAGRGQHLHGGCGTTYGVSGGDVLGQHGGGHHLGLVFVPAPARVLAHPGRDLFGRQQLGQVPLDELVPGERPAELLPRPGVRGRGFWQARRIPAQPHATESLPYVSAVVTSRTSGAPFSRWPAGSRTCSSRTLRVPRRPAAQRVPDPGHRTPGASAATTTARRPRR